MNLKGLVHREIGEGLTEELASTVGVPARTISNILADELPQDHRAWEQFAQYFLMDTDFLRSGGPPHTHGTVDLRESSQPYPIGPLMKVPLLRWDQINQMVSCEESPHLFQAETVLETDVPGTRTFDNPMQPLFSQAEIMFINPDFPTESGHYVLIESEDGGSEEEALLQQLKEIGGQSILHPLNRRYDNRPLTKQQRIWGRVVRLRKNL